MYVIRREQQNSSTLAFLDLFFALGNFLASIYWDSRVETSSKYIADTLGNELSRRFCLRVMEGRGRGVSMTC